MKVKYIGKNFGVDGLTNSKVYECIAIEGDYLRIIDDSGEDYLYSAEFPGASEYNSDEKGRWEIVEDINGLLSNKLLIQIA
jgi:hypothetical protein